MDEDTKTPDYKGIVEKLISFDPAEYSLAGLCDNEGTGYGEINDENREEFYPILLEIEEAFLLHYYDNPNFKDIDVIETLKRLRDNFDKPDFMFSELEQEIINRLKFVLLLYKYNRSDLSKSFSCLLGSVRSHHSNGGSRGYLKFIDETLSEIVDDEDTPDSEDASDSEDTPDSEDYTKDNFWEKGGFIEGVPPDDIKDKMRTFHMGHDEEMDYDCKRCSAKISAHNKDWHDFMCDRCFNEEHYSDQTEILTTDLDEIKERCDIDKDLNLIFRDFLKSDKFDPKKFAKVVKYVEDNIDCTKCANCCKTLKIPINEEDIKRISDYLKITNKEFIDKYTIKNNDNEMFLESPCKFLEDNKCKIYDVRPKKCKDYPNLHKDVTTRTVDFLSNARMCPIVFNVLENSCDVFTKELFEFEEETKKNG